MVNSFDHIESSGLKKIAKNIVNLRPMLTKVNSFDVNESDDEEDKF